MKAAFSALLYILCLAAAGSVAAESRPRSPLLKQPKSELDFPLQDNRCKQRICTMQYEPVCATIEVGGRTYRQTFSNSCMVCSSRGIITKIRKGACGNHYTVM